MLITGISSAIIGYLGVGYLFHHKIFPENRPEPVTYFKPGDVIETKRGGNKLEVLSNEGEDLRLKVTFSPHAEGPPVHIQTGWDEFYKIHSGKLTLLLNGKEKQLGPGEEYTIPRGVPHKPSNPTSEPVVGEVVMPAQFVMYLSQVYGVMDEGGKYARPPSFIFQMALFNQYFDSYLGEGPPIWLQKGLNFLLIPLARLMGYKSYYEKYRI